MVLRKNLSSEMDVIVPTPRTATVVLITLFLLVQLCGANIVYAERGSSPKLPCPCPSCSGTTLISWYCVQQGQTALLFRKTSNNQITRFPAAWSRLKLLQNNSLQFHPVRDNDTGRYWCDMHSFYDLVVVKTSPLCFLFLCKKCILIGCQTPMAPCRGNSRGCVWSLSLVEHRFFQVPCGEMGSQQRLESHQADSTCFVLSCSFPSNEFYRNIEWWDGGKQILDIDQVGTPSIFQGRRASQLHICVKKEALEKTPKKHIKCRFNRKTEITFKLTDNQRDRCTCSTLMPSLQDAGTVKNSLSSQCSEVKINEVPWIPLAVCIILQFLIILTLVVLWRRSCSQRYTDHLKKPQKDIPLSEYTPQIYENI